MGFGIGHINKGTSEMGNSIYEYEYIEQYQKRSHLDCSLDLWIIWKGVILILKEEDTKFLKALI